MALFLIRIKQQKKDMNTVRSKRRGRAVEAELFAQLLDDTEMFCLIWTPIWWEFVQLDTPAEIYVVMCVCPREGV